MEAGLPFDHYPGRGREQLGPCRGKGYCRNATGKLGYGEEVMQRTGIRACIYCGQDLTESLVHWLTFQRDHIVPRTVCERLGVPGKFYDDLANMACVCAACNAYDNRVSADWAEPPLEWTWEQFLSLRDQVYTERRERIHTCLEPVWARFAAQTWLVVDQSPTK